jgi:ADP-ribosylation factor GTPase-activating protein 2/3
MKMGGNGTTLEFFKQHGGSIIESKDAQVKYTSRAATLWKDKLKQLVEEDKRK